VRGLALARVFAMPNAATFDVPPVRAFVERYAAAATMIVDPFAGASRIGHVRNDLRNVGADHQMDALAFLERLRDEESRPDLVLFDPPYSLRQLKECYESAGLAFTKRDGWRPNRWTAERDVIAAIVPHGGVVLSFGWSSNGMGKKRGFEVEEVLLVNHGAGHHDTICLAERRVPPDALAVRPPEEAPHG
jgi:hypothetical protein